MKDRDTVLGKALAILRAFGPADSVLPLAELVRRTDLPKGTVHRVAGDLVHHRLLDKTAHGYRLSGGLFELGLRAATERTLLELAMPFLQDLYERTHETVHLGVREGHEVVYIATAACRRPWSHIKCGADQDRSFDITPGGGPSPHPRGECVPGVAPGRTCLSALAFAE
jgi:DNA-binding IclR family transcriptional regulator